MITFLKKYANDSFEKLVNEIHWMDLPFRLKAIFSKLVPQEPKYKVYTALLTQSGTDAPVATVLENTLGGDVVWIYDGVGEYSASSSQLFTENKTTFIVSSKVSNISIGGDVTYTFVDNNSYLSLNTYKFISPNFEASNGMLNKNFVEIRVYN